jgi:hypothetical protein
MIVIFLDIDGVILHPRDKDRIKDHLKRQYTELKIEESQQDFSSKACDQAAVELFDKSALARLNELIAIIEQRGEKVGIVISSAWREKQSVSQLITLFQQHDFSKKIIGKTADRIQLTNSRGEEIRAWLQQNRLRFQIINFLILDDVDSGISELFAHNFIECSDGSFSPQDLEKAYSLLRQKTLTEAKENHPVNMTIISEEASMTKINISGLSKERVILALFKNVYGKSEEAKQTKINIMRYTPNEPGIYSEPHDFEISEMLRRNQFIDYLGCVKIFMDFSQSIIDTDLYDTRHKTGTNGIESATAVIEKLRPRRELKDEKKSTFSSRATNSRPPLHSNYSFTGDMEKKNTDKSSKKAVAEEKLTLLLEKPCRLAHLYLDHYVLEFSSEQSYETLQKDAALLASKEIAVVATASSSLCGGLVKIPAKLEFEGSLNDMVAKLGFVVSPHANSTVTSSI